MSLLDLVDENRPEILRIAAKHGAHDVRLFGSVARGDDHEGSDVDLLADYREDGWEMRQELEALLGVKVDVVPYEVHPYMRERVMAEAIPLDLPNFRERAVLESQRLHPPMDRDRLHLILILEACDTALEYAAEGRAIFDQRRVYRDAIVTQLTQIGEEAGKVSQEFRDKHPEIPWAQARAFRNQAVHNYPDLSMPNVWVIVAVHVPTLKAQLEKLL